MHDTILLGATRVLGLASLDILFKNKLRQEVQSFNFKNMMLLFIGVFRAKTHKSGVRHESNS